MSDTLQEREDQNARLIGNPNENADWCDDCHGYMHMPRCPAYKHPKEVTQHNPAAADIGSLLDQLRTQWLEVVKERDELRKVVQELLNRFYPHQCDSGPTCYKCRALRRGTAILNDQKERSE